MRTTVNLDDELVKKAMRDTGIKEKTTLLHEGLRSLIQREAARRLILLGGSQPDFEAGRRRRSALPDERDPPKK